MRRSRARSRKFTPALAPSRRYEVVPPWRRDTHTEGYYIWDRLASCWLQRGPFPTQEAAERMVDLMTGDVDARDAADPLLRRPASTPDA